MDKIAHLTVKYLSLSETFIYEQIRNMTHYEPVVFTLLKKYPEKYKVPNIYAVSDLPKYKQASESIRSIFGRSDYFRRLIKELDIKLIHAHFAYMGNYAMQFKKYYDIPLITSFYGLDIYQLTKNPLYRLQLQRLWTKGDLFMGYSTVMKERAIELGCPADKIVSLPIGIDLSKFAFKERKPADAINFLYIGRLVEKKGVIYAIRAFAKAYQKHKNITFTLVGDGPLRAQLESEVDCLGMGGPIKMLGAVPDIKPELDKAHVFVSPSVVASNGDAEGGINVTVIEALASGLPALVTRQTQSEIVHDGKSGFIVRENDPDDLSEKMDILIKYPQKITEFGIMARRFAESMDSKKQVAKLEDIYKELISRYEKDRP